MVIHTVLHCIIKIAAIQYSKRPSKRLAYTESVFERILSTKCIALIRATPFYRSAWSVVPSRKGVEHIRFSPANICLSISKKPCNIRILLRLFASSCLNICEVKTVPPCGEKIFDGFLRSGARESADFSSHTTLKYAKICRRRAYVFDFLAATRGG